MRFLTTVLVLCGAAESSAQFNHRDFEKLYALEGTWQMEAKGGFRYEHWEKKSNDLLLSRSFRISDNDTTTLETVRLAFIDGEVVYAPTVPDQNEGKPVTFRLSKIDGGSFHFENKEHDFPQRIIYTLKNKTELECVIDGNTPKGYAKQTYPFRKI